MTSDDYRVREIERLRRLASEHDPSQRAEFLRRVCGDDESLLHEVESQFAHNQPGPAPDQTQSLVGRRLGPYDILSPVGKGGMGEVYRARDTRLDRVVAIKALPAGRARDPERRRLFEREARAVSTLNHPHICMLHDVGITDGVDFLVMEFVDGETLAQRLRKGPLPLDQVLRYAMQMADALADAHRHGIVHRDFKPGNIMLTRSGVKLLDFGLARVFEAAPAGEVATTGRETATITMQRQTIVGTLPYMAPEQLDSDKTDARSDIFALGTVVYEMATGRQAFEGKSPASLIVAIQTAEPPPISTFRKMAAPALDHLVRTCLAKEPDARWESARDVLLQLKWIDEAGAREGSPGQDPAATHRRLRRRTLLAAAGWAAALILAIAVWIRWPVGPPVRVLRFALTPPREFQYPVISPDGRHIAYVLHPDEVSMQSAGTAAPEAAARLFIHDLDRETPREIEGSEGAELPFWSPDSKFIAFGARNQVWKTAIQTGATSPICSISEEFLGGTWNIDGHSITYSIYRHGVYEVSAGGGTPELVLPESQTAFRNHVDTPKLLPWPGKGRALLYSTQQKNAAVHDIVLHSPESGKGNLLVAAADLPVYSPSGHVLYISMADSLQLLMALPFSTARMQAAGDAFPIGQSGFSPSTTAVSPSVSTNGTLAYKAVEHSPRTLVWRDRQNNIVTPLPTELNSAKHVLVGARNMTLAADGHSLAFDAFRNRGRQLWIVDISRGTTTRLPSSSESDADPVWTPTGKEITFRSNHNGYWEIYNRSVDPSVGGAKLLVAGPLTKKPTDWSPDGRFLLYDVDNTKTRSDIWYVKAKDAGGGYESAPLLETPAAEFGAQFSPDGRFFAYVSDQSGRQEVYIARFPDGSAPRRISVIGGVQPLWARDGKELFFIQGDTLVSVAVATKPDLSIGETQSLFRVRYPTELGQLHYAVSANGQRFLLAEPSGPVPPPFIRIVENWFAEFSDGSSRP